MVPGPSWLSKSSDAQVPYINGTVFASNLCTSSHILTPSLNYLEYLIQFKYYINCCLCLKVQVLLFGTFWVWFFFFPEYFQLEALVESMDLEYIDMEGQLCLVCGIWHLLSMLLFMLLLPLGIIFPI